MGSAVKIEEASELAKRIVEAPDLYIALDHERAVMAALIVFPKAWNKVCHLLEPSSFYSEPNREIFMCIQDMKKSDIPVDVLTVSQHLRKKGKLEEIGGAFYLADLTRYAFSEANIETHAMTLVDNEYMRIQATSAKEFMLAATEGNPDSHANFAKLRRDMEELEERMTSKSVSTTKEIVEVTLSEIYDREKEKPADEKSYLNTGYGPFNQLLIGNGIGKGRLGIIAARTSIGKSTFMLNLAANMAQSGHHLGFFSLEMTSISIMERMFAMESTIPSYKLALGKMSEDEWRELSRVASDMMGRHMHFKDKPQTTLEQIVSSIRAMKQRHDIRVAFVDYLQLMRTQERFGSREQQVSHISRLLKECALELQIPIITASQINRDAARSSDVRPRLHQLRESGSLEQDADDVWLLHNPDRSGVDADDDFKDNGCELFHRDANGKLVWQGMECRIAKQRNGLAGDNCNVYFKYYIETGKMVPYETGVTPPPPTRTYRDPSQAQDAEFVLLDSDTGESHVAQAMPF